MKETKRTLYELVAGIIVCFFLLLFGNIFVSDRTAYTLGTLLGSILAVVLSVHMYYALERAMLYDEETAAKKVKKSTIFRYIIMLSGLAAALLLPEWLSVAGVALGMLSLKFSAYLQPLTHKVFIKIINKGR